MGKQQAMERELCLSVDEQPQLATIHVSGHFAQLEVYKFKNLGEALVESGRRFVIVELSKSMFIDSAGIGSLTYLLRICEKTGGKLVLALAQDSPLRETFNHAQLHKIMPITESLEAARKWLADTYGLQLTRSTDQTETANQKMLDTINTLLTKIEKMEERLSAIESSAKRKKDV